MTREERAWRDAYLSWRVTAQNRNYTAEVAQAEQRLLRANHGAYGTVGNYYEDLLELTFCAGIAYQKRTQ